METEREYRVATTQKYGPIDAFAPLSPPLTPTFPLAGMKLSSKAQLIMPGMEEYDRATARWAENAEKRASMVVRTACDDDVVVAVHYAREMGLEIAALCGGHSPAGASSTEGGMVVDLGHLMNAVRVDPVKKLVYAQGGALWRDVDKAAAAYGLAAVGGTVDHTGIGGLTLGGGYGWLTGRYGMAVDNLEEVRMVLASGEIVTANEKKNADLFWGIRGGGPNFGIVTEFVYRAHPQEAPVWAGWLAYSRDKTAAVISAVIEWRARQQQDEALIIFIGRFAPLNEPVILIVPFYNGPEAEARASFHQFLSIERAYDTCGMMPYEQTNTLQNSFATHGQRKGMTGCTLGALTPEHICSIFDEYICYTESEPETRNTLVHIELHSPSKLLSIPVTAMAYPHRDNAINVVVAQRWTDPSKDEAVHAWARSLAAKIGSTTSHKRIYANYQSSPDDVRLRAAAFFGPNFPRLARLKHRYDPECFFHKWFCIPPDPQAGIETEQDTK